MDIKEMKDSLLKCFQDESKRVKEERKERLHPILRSLLVEALDVNILVYDDQAERGVFSERLRTLLVDQMAMTFNQQVYAFIIVEDFLERFYDILKEDEDLKQSCFGVDDYWLQKKDMVLAISKDFVIFGMY